MSRRYRSIIGLASAAALAATVIATGTASAEEPSSSPRLDEQSREAVRERLRPVDEQATDDIGATSRSAAASSDFSTAALPPELCYGREYADPDEPGDALIDAMSYGLGFDCVSSTFALGVDTIDEFLDSDLGWLDLAIDSNGNMGDGCSGYDFIAIIYYDAGMWGGMFRTPSCDVDRWTDVSNNKLGYIRPAANQIGLTFNGAPFAGSSTLRWSASITHWDAYDPVDWMPDSGTRSAPGNPCGMRCFYLTNGTTGGAADVAFKDDQPATEILIGDWNADGGDSFGFRLNNSYALKNALAPTPPDITFAYGRTSDVVLVGDWDGDGTDTLAVRRGNTYYLKNSYGGGEADITVAYGRPDDVVLVGDWDGNGTDTLAVRRGSHYYIKNSFTGGAADTVVAYGRAGDTVLVGDWDGDGDDTLGVRRASTYYLKNTISGGTADVTFAYGRPSDVTFVGDWNADGRDTLGVRR